MAMYATIEPRLITLLNDPSLELAQYPRLESLGLPPLDNNIRTISGRPPRHERDASIHNEKYSILNSQQHGSLERENLESTMYSNSTGEPPQTPSATTDRALGCRSPQSLQKILDNVSLPSQSHPSKRRQRQDSIKDEFVQLPQPPKKQKIATQVVPPIIIGLFEPPPNAALFPPISSSSFHDSHGRNSLNAGPTSEPKKREACDSQSKCISKPAAQNPGKRLVTRTRKKWTDAETNQLLLGVNAHGVGNWTKILQDPLFRFDGRRAVDLKDRFRTCCPTELCAKSRPTTMPGMKNCGVNGVSRNQAQTVHYLDGTLAESDSSGTDDKADSAAKNVAQKSRTHRRRLQDLAELGIKEPFKRSRRRERRPFSEGEDRDILQGFQEYGPAWTRILADPRFNLRSRRATDLRDRLRNRYPEKYFLEEHGRDSTKDMLSLASQATPPQSSSHNSGSQDLLGPSNALAHPSMSGIFSKDALFNFAEHPPLVESSDPLSFDWSDPTAAFPNTIGEMDKSRILLDDPWNSRRIG